MQLVQEIEERIKRNKEAIEILKEEYIKACRPQGYRSGTSYLDADCIHGSRKTHRLQDMIKGMETLENLIFVDETILGNYKNKERIQNKLLELPNIKDKVTYLRKVEGKTQEETAEILGVTDRHIRRIESK